MYSNFWNGIVGDLEAGYSIKESFECSLHGVLLGTMNVIEESASNNT